MIKNPSKTKGFLVIIIILGILSASFLLTSWTDIINLKTSTTNHLFHLIQKKQACELSLLEAQKVLMRTIKNNNNETLKITHPLIHSFIGIENDYVNWKKQASTALIALEFFNQVNSHYLIQQISTENIITTTLVYENPGRSTLTQSITKSRKRIKYKITARCTKKNQNNFFEHIMSTQILFGDIINQAKIEKTQYQLTEK